jgi:hypothetical protein
MEHNNINKGMSNRMSGGAAMAFGMNRDSAVAEEESPTFK